MKSFHRREILDISSSVAAYKYIKKLSNLSFLGSLFPLKSSTGLISGLFFIQSIAEVVS